LINLCAYNNSWECPVPVDNITIERCSVCLDNWFKAIKFNHQELAFKRDRGKWEIIDAPT